ncbi:hypothetical protein C5F46_11680 [Phaeovulum veldkampii DSM 11550]|uniref:Uncharacterized protein n=1 Tax=Phaeovulum veldkampii DSM 11550 TaxID=1185920 RepID=A0A2T4JG84_9RHOB|nr:hypothetical protein C5F46_11680 [Phaeovulum veldkampii DSM 11550]
MTKVSEFAGMQRAAYQEARDAGNDVARSVGAYCAEAGGGGAGVAMGVASGTQTGGGGSWQLAPKRLKGRAWVEEAKRRRDAGVPIGDIIREAGRDADLEAAELRGFYQGRNQAWRLLMENQKRHPDTIKVSRAFLADFQRDILHMNKEG